MEEFLKELPNYSNNENADLRTSYLRQKFSDLASTLEEEIACVVEKHMAIWKEEHLPIYKKALHTMIVRPTATLVDPISSNKQNSRDEQLPNRVFIPRQSLLTELLTVNHITSIYNIFLAILFLLFINKAVEEVVQTGRINFGLSYVVWSFGNFDGVVLIWLCMKLSTLIIVYFCFHHWAYYRQYSPGLYDVTASLIFIIYLTAFLYLPIHSLVMFELPPASSVIILCEQIRLFMKTWAFVRSNIDRARFFKKVDSAHVSSPCPEFSHYMYFLFVPTLLYREDYPRNESCNWSQVAKDFIQVLGCILCSHFLLARFCFPVFEQFGKEEFSLSTFMMTIFSSCFPASMVFLCAFFSVLHSWMNAFAEMFGFADRLFYKDWWNSTSYPRFYRTWNCIVHDWLYEYVYKELSDLQSKYGLLAQLRCLPMLVVFFISATVHEYILAFAFRFFYPVLLVMFGGFGVLLMFFNTKATFFNVFLWVTLILGSSILMCLYSMEWYARINCPSVVDGWGDYFIPRSWFCHIGPS